FQFRAHLGEWQLEIDALARRQVVGGQKLAPQAEERNAEGVELVAPDREARRHRVAAVFLETVADLVERAMQVEAGYAAAGAAAEFTRLVPPDQERRPAVALDEAGRHDPDHPRMPG